jgi:type II secretory pathway predicted ATPase ExeA
MFEHHFGLRENPFPAGHQLKFVYPSREHQEARAHLRYGIENREPFLLITGEVGTGKTTSLYDALNEWGDRVAVALITNSSLTRQEMLEEICLRFGLPVLPNTSKPALMVALEKHLIAVRAKGEHAVLMMDEAQNLSMDLLEEIRLLSNLEHRGDKLLQIFLVGQPELEAHLARHELRQLRQRITVHYRLNPLSSDETLGYIHHHVNVAGGNGVLVFPTDTCREIYRLTHGIPREINTIASSALIAAYADGAPSVTPEHVIAVAQEGDFRSVLAGPVVRHGEPPAPVARGTAPAAPPAAAVPPMPPAAAMAPAPPAPPAAAMPTPPPPTPLPRPQVLPAEPAATPWPVFPQMQLEPTRPPFPPQMPAAIPAASAAPAAAAPPPPIEIPPAAATPRVVVPEPFVPAMPVAPVAPAAPAAAPPAAAPAPVAPAMPTAAAAAERATTPSTREAAPVGPPPPERPAPALREVPPPPDRAPSRRERGEFSKGVVAAMKLTESAAPALPPTPAPPRRPTFATPPPPVPLPLPDSPTRAAEPPRGVDSSALPPRLRDRLERELANDDTGMSPLRGWLIVVSVLATVGIILILMQRFGAIDVPILRGPAGTQANRAGSEGPEGLAPTTPGGGDPGAAVLDSLRRQAEAARPSAPVRSAASRSEATQPARSRVTSAPGETGGAETPVPAPAARTTSPPPTSTPATRTGTSGTGAQRTTAGAPAASAPAAAYGVGVASYLDEDRANVERDRLTADTSLPAVVVSYQDAGTTMYRVVLGRWPSSAEAERAANDLMERGAINEARVMRLPRR